jgi:hypothetical protein
MAGAVMWNLSSDDLQRAKERISRDRAELEANYHERLKALDTAFAEIETVERVAADFAEKHFGGGVVVETAESPEAADAMEEADTVEDEEATAANGEAKTGSRWRLHLGNRPAE